ncbi:helix-turn-helix transcriptional regulator [Streptomyces sp. CC210A]|uniref:helix-turn-helix transcriptional regulator n=1 Tax=Streptomyces sp. CC210A TaxID=2898184 RepID=UPI001F1FA83C|nr:helix-turn-helix transcriptional regulator [Streptomyces sp. CC210A]
MPRPTDSPARVLARRRAIGDRIRAARLHANLTQVALALRIGMARHSLNRIEQGHSAARIDVPVAGLVR